MRGAVAHLQRADPVIARIIAAVGPCRISYTEPVVGSLVRSIIYQQLSGRVASVIHGRLVALTGEPVRPSAILRLTPEQMRSAGLSQQKAAYIRDLAERARSIGFPRLPQLSDDEVIERLTVVKGVGVWTAQMFLIFSLRRPNVLPVGDLGVRMAIRNCYSLADLPSPKEMQAIAEPWHPWCSAASWYLWRSLELKPSDPGV
ncbi:MAG TPA: DNA-3-methyladenine glycosylase 2 family protein [Bryobacteraceae bacterium]|nr:DNA-3-methyladenine glycosylase 2 family protein [Bryobacteraceae bacterium]